MRFTSLPRLCEQRKVDKLLLRLAKMQLISGKPDPIVLGKAR
jgi:hypothetical protein